ncbi:hydroxymethylglutaryl-CoA reductase, degradative [Streptomyces sp. NBC_01264]|uniref:hydroxymethylglutaryl-CoA reductase, degradative n=1 Tax=Streptomyces sp. NBC_01264 TaxID=2903804 RepID=UPI0022595997|nr:hydroxymethylglutaryl-CoA reductase, degradative [Streptomyces sp. NBC_01264]
MRNQHTRSDDPAPEDTASSTRSAQPASRRAASPANGRTSRYPGFHRLPLGSRVDWLTDMASLTPEERQLLQSDAPLPLTHADTMIENAVAVYGLPYALAVNFVINGTDVIVPMVIEEPSVVAAASHAARLTRSCGGISADADPALMPGQIHITDLSDANASATRVHNASARLLAEARHLQPRMVARGCGACRVTAQALPDGSLLVTFIIDVGDAMGANAVNSLLEDIAPEVVAVTGGTLGVRIISNLADHRMAHAHVDIPDRFLASRDHDASESAERIAQASLLATMSTHRAATHNKGVMNGIDAVALATGQDWRAIEAGVHAFAAHTGSYQPVTTWHHESGQLRGRFEAPIVVGTVGRRIQANPRAALSLKLMGISSARELATVMAAVGLAQNLAALRALTTEGIQRGHMALHQRYATHQSHADQTRT